MSAAEFAEWMAFDSIDAIGEYRADLRAARIGNVLSRLVFKQALPLDYFMYVKRAEASAPQTPDWKADKARFKQFARIHNAKVEREKKQGKGRK